MQQLCQRLAAARGFERLIVGLIVLNGVLVGLETAPSITDRHGTLIAWLHDAILAAFVVEAGIKIAAVAPRVGRYFRDPWNLFDLSVIVLSLLPFSGELAMVARLARLLRVLRLISVLPKLRLVVATLVHALPSMGHVLLLVALLFYVYAVAGWHLFHADDPGRWGTLGRALLTLLQIATLDSWSDVMVAGMRIHPYAWLYFVSFVIVGTFVVINLFVAVVINSLEESKLEREPAPPPAADAVRAELAAVRAALERLEARIGGAQGSAGGRHAVTGRG